MSPSIIVLSNDSRTQSSADRISADLSKLGFKIDRGAKAAKIETAHRVIVLWSRAARGTPALRAAVRRARAKGTLVCVGPHAAPPLIGAKRIKQLPRTSAAWRAALAKQSVAPPAKKRARPRARAKRTPRTRAADGGTSVTTTTTTATARRSAPILGFLATLIVFGAAVGAGMYQADAGFATKVNTLAGEAQAQVAALTAKH